MNTQPPNDLPQRLLAIAAVALLFIWAAYNGVKPTPRQVEEVTPKARNVYTNAGLIQWWKDRDAGAWGTMPDDRPKINLGMTWGGSPTNTPKCEVVE